MAERMRIFVDRHGRPCDPLRHDAKSVEVVPKAQADKLAEALEEAATYVRLGMTWIEDEDRHDKMKRAWERARASLAAYETEDR